MPGEVMQEWNPRLSPAAERGLLAVRYGGRPLRPEAHQERLRPKQPGHPVVRAIQSREPRDLPPGWVTRACAKDLNVKVAGQELLHRPTRVRAEMPRIENGAPPHALPTPTPKQTIGGRRNRSVQGRYEGVVAGDQFGRRIPLDKLSGPAVTRIGCVALSASTMRLSLHVLPDTIHP
jgi:hypothetical protein